MKKTIILLVAVMMGAMTFAQRSHHSMGATVLTPRQLLKLNKGQQAKGDYLYKLFGYYSDDEYSNYGYYYDAQGRCNAIHSEEGFAGFDDYMNIYDSLKYDAQGNVSRIDGYQWLNNQWKHTYYLEYTYNERGQITSRKNYNNFGGEWSLGGTYYFRYNSDGQLMRTVLDFAGGWYDSCEYIYVNGRLDHYMYTLLWDGSQTRCDYSYDNNGNLVEEAIYMDYDGYGQFSLYERYTNGYDESGNVTRRSYFNSANRELSRDEYTFEGRLLSNTYIPLTYDNIKPEVFNNRNTYWKSSYYIVDDNTMELEYLCDYYYNYGGFNDILAATEAKVNVYPNPAVDMVTVQIQDGDNILKVFDMAGRCVKMQRINGTDVTLNVSSLAAGTYVVRTEGKQARTAKIEIAR